MVFSENKKEQIPDDSTYEATPALWEPVSKLILNVCAPAPLPIVTLIAYYSQI